MSNWTRCRDVSQRLSGSSRRLSLNAAHWLKILVAASRISQLWTVVQPQPKRRLGARSKLARVRELARQYARFRLAAYLLEREIEHYRKDNQGPLLKRAEETLLTAYPRPL